MLEKVLARDRDDRLRPVAIQSGEGQQLLAGVPPDERLDSWHLVEPDGAVRSAGDAAAPLARLLPRWRWTATGFERFPGATERAYRLVADNRSRLSKLFVLPLLVIALLVGGGCGSNATEEAVLTVYVSGPPNADRAKEVAAGAEMALADVGGEAGGIEVRVLRLDGEGSDAAITQAAAGANARTATEDSSSIAYLGELVGPRTALSVPITNEAGLLQLAPEPVPEELVRESEGSTGVPTRFQPSGERTLGALDMRPADRSAADALRDPDEPPAAIDQVSSGDQLAGYAAMELILDAIDAAQNPLDRRSVIDSYLAATDRDSILGPYTVDQVGQAVFDRR